MRLIRGEIINDVTSVVTRQLAINRNVISVRSGSDTDGQTKIFNQKHTMQWFIHKDIITALKLGFRCKETLQTDIT